MYPAGVSGGCLTSLASTHAGVTDAALTALSQGLPQLEVLGLPHCVEATDQGLLALIKCTTLTELNLACTNVGRCVCDRRENRVPVLMLTVPGIRAVAERGHTCQLSV